LGTKEHGWAQENHAKFTRARAARGSLLGHLFKDPSQTRDLTNNHNCDVVLQSTGR